MNVYKQCGVYTIISIAQFVSEDVLSEIVIMEIEKNGFTNIMPLMPFIDSDIVSNYIRKHVK